MRVDQPGQDHLAGGVDGLGRAEPAAMASGVPTPTMSVPSMATAPGAEDAPRRVHRDDGPAGDDQGDRALATPGHGPRLGRSERRTSGQSGCRGGRTVVRIAKRHAAILSDAVACACPGAEAPGAIKRLQWRACPCTSSTIPSHRTCCSRCATRPRRPTPSAAGAAHQPRCSARSHARSPQTRRARSRRRWARPPAAASATDVVVVPVLRAGLGMLEAVLELLPRATGRPHRPAA